MKCSLALGSLLVAALAACSNAPVPAGPGDSGDLHATTDAASDSSAAPPDASRNDAELSQDSSPSKDAGACTPAPGTMTVTGECDQVSLAILRNGNAATAAVQGRVNAGGSGNGACNVVDSIDVNSGGTTIDTIPGSANEVPPDGNIYPLANGPAATALTALCASDTGRFDGLGLVVHGRMNGGAFTVSCGDNTPDVGWPPRVVLTCHTGLTEMPMPLATDATVMSSSFMGMALTNDQIFSLVPQPPVLMTVDSTVHLIPDVAPFSGTPPIMPSDTTGWMGAASTMMQEGGATASNVSLSNSTDVLGQELCPLACTMPPCMPITPPVFLARITGTANTGVFESELYVPGCFTEP